ANALWRELSSIGNTFIPALCPPLPAKARPRCSARSGNGPPVRTSPIRDTVLRRARSASTIRNSSSTTWSSAAVPASPRGPTCGRRTGTSSRRMPAGSSRESAPLEESEECGARRKKRSPHSSLLTPHFPPNSSLLQDGQGGVVQFAVADEHVRTMDARFAAPVAEAAAGFLDDRLDGGHVPGMDAVLDHQLARTLRHQHEAVEIAKTARAF